MTKGLGDSILSKRAFITRVLTSGKPEAGDPEPKKGKEHVDRDRGGPTGHQRTSGAKSARLPDSNLFKPRRLIRAFPGLGSGRVKTNRRYLRDQRCDLSDRQGLGRTGQGGEGGFYHLSRSIRVHRFLGHQSGRGHLRQLLLLLAEEKKGLTLLGPDPGGSIF